MGKQGASPLPQMLTHVARHCADAVLSFSNEITLVASVAVPLLEFVSIWVQSNCDYDFIASQSFPPSWCSLRRPVISLPNPRGDWVYSAIDPLEPDGELVFCHNNCGRENLDPETLSKKVKIKCTLCGSTCEVKKTEKDHRTPLGRKEMIKVQFPQTRAMTSWKPPPAPQDPATGEGQTGPRKEQAQQSKKGSSQGRRAGRVQVQRPEASSEPSPLPLPTAMPPPSSTQAGVRKPHKNKRRRLDDKSFTRS